VNGVESQVHLPAEPLVVWEHLVDAASKLEPCSRLHVRVFSTSENGRTARADRQSETPPGLTSFWPDGPAFAS
jgi:hypothetical protein